LLGKEGQGGIKQRLHVLGALRMKSRTYRESGRDGREGGGVVRYTGGVRGICLKRKLLPSDLKTKPKKLGKRSRGTKLIPMLVDQE